MSKYLHIAGALTLLITAYYAFFMTLKYENDIEYLNKQIELLECYKENYLIMADSIQNIHVKCFKIGE